MDVRLGNNHSDDVPSGRNGCPLGEQPPAQPARHGIGQDRGVQTDRRRTPDVAKNAAGNQSCVQERNPQHGDQHIAKGHKIAEQHPPMLARGRLDPGQHLLDHARTAQDQQDHKRQDKSRNRQTLPQGGLIGCGRQIVRRLELDVRSHSENRSTGPCPKRGVQWRARQLKQGVGLARPQGAVDLPDQGFGAGKGLFCRNARGHGLLQRVLQGRTARGDTGGLLFAVGGCRPQGIYLCFKRLDLNGIRIASRAKLFAPFDKRVAQALETLIRQSVVLDAGLDRTGKTVKPLEIWERLRGGKPGKAQPDRQSKGKNRGASPPDHSSNTLGRMRPVPSSQDGTGRPFSRRKAGLNSFD